MALHALLHMSNSAEPVSSDALAECMGANAAQLRRTLGGLRDAGFVESTKGRGGGWRIAQPLAQTTLRDVHVALGESALFAIGHRREETECLVEQAVNAAIEDVLIDTEEYLLARFEAITLEELARDFRRRFKKARGSRKRKHHG